MDLFLSKRLSSIAMWLCQITRGYINFPGQEMNQVPPLPTKNPWIEGTGTLISQWRVLARPAGQRIPYLSLPLCVLYEDSVNHMFLHNKC